MKSYHHRGQVLDALAFIPSENRASANKCKSVATGQIGSKQLAPKHDAAAGYHIRTKQLESVGIDYMYPTP